MKNRSVCLLLIFSALLLAVLLILLFLAPHIVAIYAQWRGLSDASRRAILLSFYFAAPAAGLALVCLLLLLRNLLGDEPFLVRNARLIRPVSLCCIEVALVTAVGGIWYAPLCLVTAAMLFIFLILRVVCCCFDAAIALRDENRLTI